MPPLDALTMFFYKRPITPSKNQWIVTQIELDLCFDILYQHTKFELNRCSLSKVIERTPTFGRTNAHTDRGNTKCPSTILRMAGA